MVRSPQLEKEWALFDQQEYQRAFEEAHALLERLQGPDLRDAHRLMGLACYCQREYGQASFWFKKACQGSDEASDWFNLAVSTTMQGDSESGVQAFEQVRLCQQAAKYGQEPSFYLQLYWYACTLCDQGEYARLEPLRNELADVYRRLHSTDTSFVYSRRLPFFSSVLALAARCFNEQKKYAQGVSWLQTLGAALDDEGQRQVNRVILELQRAGGNVMHDE